MASMRVLFTRLFLGLTLLTSLAEAKTFRTQFIKLELPANWDCRQEEIDWVCQPDNLAERSEAILVVVTKAVNEVDDNYPKYKEELEKPRDMRDLLGNAYKSQVKYVRERQILNHPWVDALHLGSEIPGFYTRYVASIREKVAGLITYSVAESVFPKYAQVMDQMIDTAEIFFDPKAFAEAMQSGSGSLLGARSRTKGRLAPTLEAEEAKTEEGTDQKQMLVGLALAAGAVAYIIYKRRKRG
jgi:hypothetical protein